MNNWTVTKQLKINASIEKVWQALTNLDILKQMMFGCNVVTDWNIGSEILFKGSWEGKEFMDKGKILNFEKEKLYEYSYWSSFSDLEDIPENYSKVKFEIEPNEKGTVLTLTQRDFPTQTMSEHSNKNWDAPLSILKELIEQE